MADNLPNGYSDLLRAAQQGLVRMPDGTYQPAPQYGGATSLSDIYRGIYGGGNQGNIASSVSDSPLGAIYSGQNTARGSGGLSPSQPMGGLQAIQEAFGGPSASGTVDLNKGQDRIPSSSLLPPGIEQAYADQGGGIPLPRARPPTPMPPLPRVRPPTPSGFGGTNITVPYNAAPQTGGEYVVKHGDTLWDISRKTGIPIQTIAAQSGIRDPNRLMVGQRLYLSPQQAPTPMPGRPPNMRTNAYPGGGGWAPPSVPSSFLSGPHGQTDWSVANQGMAGIRGPNNARGPMPPSLPIPRGVSPEVHAQLMAQQEQHNDPTPYSQSPAGRDPSIHERLMAQQTNRGYF